VEPLAAPGMERQVAAAFALALAGCEPSPIAVELERHASSPPWAELLRDAWPGGRGGWLWARSSEPVPYTEVPAGFDAWFGAKSSSFRREMRRKQRRLEEAGAAFREATPETLAADVQAFLRLHRARLADRGGTSLGEPGVEPMLASVGAELLGPGRCRLLMIDVAGEPIAAQLVVSAGGEVCAWNTGFDEAHAKLSPLMLCMLRVIEEAADGSDRRVSLGPGAQAYKSRLCEGEDSLRRDVLVPRGASYLLARLRLAPAQLRAYARRRRAAPRTT
jgi:CelD/BcsL family acetyltransferase involved in cellulose biosynthesis